MANYIVIIDHIVLYIATSLQVLLLDNKKSMSVNIFLKQFKEHNQKIVAMIREGNDANIGNERLRGLQKILPYAEDVSIRIGLVEPVNIGLVQLKAVRRGTLSRSYIII